MVIKGQGRGLKVQSGEIDTHKDHRIAMTFAVLALAVYKYSKHREAKFQEKKQAHMCCV